MSKSGETLKSSKKGRNPKNCNIWKKLKKSFSQRMGKTPKLN